MSRKIIVQEKFVGAWGDYTEADGIRSAKLKAIERFKEVRRPCRVITRTEFDVCEINPETLEAAEASFNESDVD